MNSIVIIINKLGLMMAGKPTYEELKKEIHER